MSVLTTPSSSSSTPFVGPSILSTSTQRLPCSVLPWDAERGRRPLQAQGVRACARALFPRTRAAPAHDRSQVFVCLRTAPHTASACNRSVANRKARSRARSRARSSDGHTRVHARTHDAQGLFSPLDEPDLYMAAITAATITYTAPAGVGCARARARARRHARKRAHADTRARILGSLRACIYGQLQHDRRVHSAARLQGKRARAHTHTHTHKHGRSLFAALWYPHVQGHNLWR